MLFAFRLTRTWQLCSDLAAPMTLPRGNHTGSTRTSEPHKDQSKEATRRPRHGSHKKTKARKPQEDQSKRESFKIFEPNRQKEEEAKQHIHN